MAKKKNWQNETQKKIFTQTPINLICGQLQ